MVSPPYELNLEKSLGRWLRARGSWAPGTRRRSVMKSGQAPRSSTVRRSMELHGQRGGIGHVTPHVLRHSAATEMLASGAPRIGVRRVLGHRSLRTTLETNAHACDLHAAEAMARGSGADHLVAIDDSA